MNNYYASEHALTKQTKVLWADRDKRMHYPEPEPIKQTKLDKREMFQQKRLFQVVRRVNSAIYNL